jgi:hypothetical protein
MMATAGSYSWTGRGFAARRVSSSSGAWVKLVVSCPWLKAAYTSPSDAPASLLRPWPCQSQAMLVAARSSHESPSLCRPL